MAPDVGVPRNILIQHTLSTSTFAICLAKAMRERTVVEMRTVGLITQPSAQVYRTVSSTNLGRDLLTNRFKTRLHGMGAGTNRQLGATGHLSNPTQARNVPISAIRTVSLLQLYRIMTASAAILILPLIEEAWSPLVTLHVLAMSMLPAADHKPGMSLTRD